MALDVAGGCDDGVLRYVSLFSGIGGFEAGLAAAGLRMKCVGYSEVDPMCIKVYESHFKHPALGSVVDLDAARLEGLGRVDLVVGGPPCQDLTVANNFGGRSGLSGSRSGLFYEFARVVRALRPRYVIMENVARMSAGDRDEITRELRDAAPHIGMRAPVVIDSAAFSAQRRLRMYWTNFEVPLAPAAAAPRLADVLLPRTAARALEHSEAAKAYMNRKSGAKQRVKWAYGVHSDSRDAKSRTVTRAWHKGKPYNVLVDRRFDGTEHDLRTVGLDGRGLVRSFAVVEAERLQTFEEGWVGERVAKTHALTQLGNAVTVAVVAHVARALLLAQQHAAVATVPAPAAPRGGVKRPLSEAAEAEGWVLDDTRRIRRASD